ncbi:CaiB/BaiF CoA transferase family protein [Propionicicella superfundia]|uniref:CaiB/BaiF CoA transferase family protein n=1 Tax=Propionicicella superfundia TaxID=348582 RepID=UPI00040CABA3|nr:CoA transferase [Propionicicella superfundia]
MSGQTSPVLDGVKVLDVSRVLAGPYCGGLLADMGADVVKVESPGGDDARHLGPFVDGESVYFAQLNRGKRSVVLDLKDPVGHATFLSLVEEADVVIENFRPGVTTRLGIDAPLLRAVNPRLVYASVSGFGQQGPFAKRPAYDLIVQAMSGLMAGTGQVGGPPTRVGESLGDLVAGLFAGWAICAALFDRSRTGRGRHVDISMFDSLLALQVTALSLRTATGSLPGRIGNRHPVSVPFDTFATTDGMVAIAVANDAIWARLCTMIGRPELGVDPRYVGDAHRSGRLEEITALVGAWTSGLDVDQVLEATAQAGVPAAPIWDLNQALGSEHARHRHTLGSFAHPVLGETPYLRHPVDFDDERSDDPPTSAPSPALGAHTADEVLASWRATPAHAFAGTTDVEDLR